MELSPIYYLVAAVIFLLLYRAFRKMSICLLITYCFLIFATTVLARTSQDVTSYDLTPFRLFRIEKWWMKRDLILQIQANILMFVPIGFLLMEIGKRIKRKAVRVLYMIMSTLAGFLFSVLIEYMQYRLHRGLCEVDDVIHNTIGTIVGIVLYWLAGRIVTELKNRNLIHFL